MAASNLTVVATLLAGCAAAGPTEVALHVSADGISALTSLTGTFRLRDEKVQRPVVAGAPIALPLDVLLVLPDGVATLGVDLSGVDASGATWSGGGDVATPLHRRVAASITLSRGATDDLGAPADLAGADFAAPPPSDMFPSRIIYRGISAGGCGTNCTRTTTLAVPPHQPGDVLVAMLSDGWPTDTSPPTFTAPSGWTQFVGFSDGNLESTFTYWRVASATEPASYTWQTGTTGDDSVGFMLALGNVDTTTPFAAEQHSVVHPGGPSSASPAIVAPGGGQLYIVGWFGAVASGGTTWSGPSALTTLDMSNAGTTRSGLVASQAVAVAGDVGSFTAVASKQQDQISVEVLLIKPAP